MQVADKHDPARHPAGLLARVGHVFDRGDRVDQGLAQVGPAPGRLQPIELRPGDGLALRRIERCRFVEARGAAASRPIEGKDRQLIGRPAVVDHLPGQRLGLPPQIAAAHARARVDQHGDPPLRRRRRNRGGPPGEETAGQTQTPGGPARPPASRSKSQLSSRLRRVSRGGVGVRNMSELNGTSPLGARRIRWNTIGAATAASPGRKAA